MAQKVQVLDIGSYSAKCVTARVPLLGYGVSGAQEVVLSSAHEAKTRRTEQLKAARDLLPGRRLAGDAVTVVMPAEKPLNRTFELPFVDRARIDSVLKFELENHLPMAAEDMVADYLILARSKAGSQIFASAVSLKEMEEQRELLETLNIDPRVLAHQAVSNGRLAELLLQAPARTCAFVDMGHRKTVVTLVRGGRFAGTRIILSGGYDLTRALAEKFSLGMDEAERLKRETHLYPAGQGTAVGRVQEAADCLRETLRPIARDVRHTFRAELEADEVYLFGGGACLGGIDVFFNEMLGKPVTLLYPSLLKVSRGVEGDGLQFVSGLAAGYAAVRGSDAARLSFRQGEWAYQGDFRFMRGRIIYLAVMALFFLAAFATPQVMRYRSVLEQEEQLRTELMEISGKILGEELDDWEEILARLEEVPSSDVWTVFPDLTAHDIYWEVADIMARIDGQPTGEQAPAPAAPVDGAATAPAAGAGPVLAEPGAGAAPGVGGPLAPAIPGGMPVAGIVPGVPLGPDGMPVAGPVPEGTVGPDGAAVAGGQPDAAVPQAIVHHLEATQVRIDGASRAAMGEGAVEFTGNASSVATMDLFLTMLSSHSCFHNVQRTKQEMLKATAGKEGWWRFTVEFTVACPKKDAKKDEAEGGEGDGKDGKGKDEKTKDDKGKGKKGKGKAGADGTVEGEKGKEPSKLKEPDKGRDAGPAGGDAGKARDAALKAREARLNGAGEGDSGGAADRMSRQPPVRDRARLDGRPVTGSEREEAAEPDPTVRDRGQERENPEAGRIMRMPGTSPRREVRANQPVLPMIPRKRVWSGTGATAPAQEE
jgi:type IV pilus assembly protein PilM